MKLSPLFSIPLVVGSSLAVPVRGYGTETTGATLTVHVSQPAKAISPDLFGIFFEDLNYAADGGLYAELVQNRSFEYDVTEQSNWNALSFWTLEKRGNGAGRLAASATSPLHEYNPHYAILMVSTPGEGVGISNSGYDGIPVKAGETYHFSVFAHQLFMGEMWSPDNGIAGRPMPVAVRLETGSGEVLAEANVRVTGSTWTKLTAELVPSRSEEAAKLVVLAQAQGGIALDEVSLFPAKTFRNRPNGLRNDLAQVIADLKPKFVRFPGGCLAHGDGLNNIYRWKNTIGPVEQRKGQRNLWGYHQSVGLGYFEYFQFCEDIGAKPLPVVSAGVCCQNSDHTPGHGQQGFALADMPGYIQDVLDLIEWANGPATSTWGAKRAAAGHPEPFHLQYLGVGNEDQITPTFKERFQMIYDAVRAKHPEITVIGTAGPFPKGEDFDKGWSTARELNVPIVDEHYYEPIPWFWENLGRYDSYDRGRGKVYVGEYAAHEKDRRNTLRSALAEAAACTQFERNGDVVQLASYAPLLARRNHTQWTPDMIYFTGTAVYPSVNYYVQQLFCSNSGDRYLETQVTMATPPAGAPSLAASTVTLGAAGDLIVKIVNGSNAPLPLRINLEGLSAKKYQAVRTVLAGPNPEAANTDGSPAIAVPVATEITVEPAFDAECAANSLTIYRIRR